MATIAALVLTGCEGPGREGMPDETEVTLDGVRATRVVDGDTLVLSTGERVRLIGIDAPERGRCGAARATAALSRWVEGRKVIVVNPGQVEDHDTHGRSLAYVGTRAVSDVGYLLVRRGLAVPRYNSVDGYGAHPAERAYADAARKATRFTCKPTPQPKPTAPPRPTAPRWTCTYSPTYDHNWHNDALCSNGRKTERPYLRPDDSYITPSEIMESARAYERHLNAG